MNMVPWLTRATQPQNQNEEKIWNQEERLWNAAKEGKFDEVQSLLDSGADIEWENTTTGSTALKAAVGVGGNHIEVVGLLLDRGANPNKVIAFQNQLDHFVLAHCNIEVLRLLLDRGMDVSKVDFNTYLRLAGWSSLERTRLLLHQCSGIDLDEDVATNVYDPYKGYTASAFGHVGCTPLSNAVRENQLPFVRLFMERGANPDITDWVEQRGALFWAVVGNNLEMVHILLDGGAYPDLADKYGCTPLSVAARRRRNGYYCIENSASDSKRDRYHSKPTEEFAKANLEIACLLLDRGANPNLADKDGKKPIDRARENGNTAILSLLQTWKAAAISESDTPMTSQPNLLTLTVESSNTKNSILKCLRDNGLLQEEGRTPDKIEITMI